VAYESGRAHIFQHTGTGRRTITSGTAREVAAFANGIAEGSHTSEFRA
jgi:hypothetical protein